MPTVRPPATTVPSRVIEMSDSEMPSRDRDRRLDERAGAGGQAAVAVEVQAAVARERLAPVGELDLDEALALDGDVERIAGLAQGALLEAAAGLDGARAGADA